MTRFITASLALCLYTSAQAHAAPPAVIVGSDIFVERTQDSRRIIQPAAQLRRGDRVVTVVRWKRPHESTSGFTVTNALPADLLFQSGSGTGEEVSVDSGRTWGQIGSLRVGRRMATPEDVTHVRWRVLAPVPSGRLAYSAIVR